MVESQTGRVTDFVLDNVLQTSSNYGVLDIISCFIKNFRNYEGDKIFECFYSVLKREESILIPENTEDFRILS